ncbi:DUF1059 domain-containing protein [uncultured Jatrophihabitans sp.]
MTCPCGQELRGETEQDYVDAVTDHVAAAHPELVGKYSREEMLSRAHDE